MHQDDAIHRVKPEGDILNYYLFDEYEVIQVDQPPHTEQLRHHHERVAETIYVLEGELVAKWREGSHEKSQIVGPGDLIETGLEPHNFANESDELARIICIKRIPTGKNLREIFKNDKIVD